MKTVKKTMRIPQDLRDTVTALHIDPAAMMQCLIDQIRFYPHFSTLCLREKQATISKVRDGLKSFQLDGNGNFDPALEEINEHYSKLMISLCDQKNSFTHIHDRQSVALIGDWEKELQTLISYPGQVMLEGGKSLHLTFDFLLCSIAAGQEVGQSLKMYMKRLPIANLYACEYAGNPFNNRMLMNFFENLWENDGEVFLPRTKVQTAIIDDYGKKFGDLFRELSTVKNYRKRLTEFRPLVKEWAEKMKSVQIADS